MPHGLPTSTSSSSGSDSSSTSIPEPLRRHNFDPHAVHPFTDCSVDLKTPVSSAPSHPSYPYPYGPTMANYDTPHVQASSSPPTTFPPSTTSAAATPIATSKSLHSSPRVAGIFVPFRKETASPDLSEILKNGQGKASSFQPDSSSRSRGAPGGNLASTPATQGRRN